MIELLAVIAIIAILASLLLPAFSRVKAKAHSAKCQSNLRQINVSHQISVDDNSGVYFAPEDLTALDPLPGDVRTEFWTKYHGKGLEWICPRARPRVVADVRFFAVGPDLERGTWEGTVVSAWGIRLKRLSTGETEALDSSYNLNGWFMGGGLPWLPGVTGYYNESDVSHPTTTPVWGDGVSQNFPLPYASSPPPWTLSDHGPGNNEFAIPRHGSRPLRSIPDADYSPAELLPGAINMAFYDGHVEQVKLERLWLLYWHKDFVPAAKRPGLK